MWGNAHPACHCERSEAIPCTKEDRGDRPVAPTSNNMFFVFGARAASICFMPHITAKKGSYAPHGTNASPLTPPTPTNAFQPPQRPPNASQRLSNTPKESCSFIFLLPFPIFHPTLTLLLVFMPYSQGRRRNPVMGLALCQGWNRSRETGQQIFNF